MSMTKNKSRICKLMMEFRVLKFHLNEENQYKDGINCLEGLVEPGWSNWLVGFF